MTSDVPDCKYGSACRYFRVGMCRFGHESDAAPGYVVENIALCRNGPSCIFLATGVCRFQHVEGPSRHDGAVATVSSEGAPPGKLTPQGVVQALP